MDFSIDDHEASNELNETSTEVPHIMFPFRDDFLQDDTIEQKRMACYYRSVRYIKNLRLWLLRTEILHKTT